MNADSDPATQINADPDPKTCPGEAPERTSNSYKNEFLKFLGMGGTSAFLDSGLGIRFTNDHDPKHSVSKNVYLTMAVAGF